ncbi:hypothetical protein B566_EDAN004697 [Ephemera danica]|nr:hypothetical protein B566_EDAN004697 [Ephemera danica]
MLLNYNESAKSKQCQCARWYPDTAGQFDTLGATNAGYASRTALTEKSKVVQMMDRLVSDIFLQQRTHQQKQEYKIPISRVEMKSATIPSNVQSKTVSNLYLGQIPVRIIVFVVSNTVLNGNAYPNGYCLYAFDLSPDLSANDCHRTLRKSGAVNIEVRFKKALPQAVNLVTFAEFQNLIQIDKQRNVSTDF